MKAIGAGSWHWKAQSVPLGVHKTGMELRMITQRILTLNDLALMLGRATDTIKKDMRRNPDAVPPRLVLPHTKLLRWRACDVDAWLALHVQEPYLSGEMQ